MPVPIMTIGPQAGVATRLGGRSPGFAETLDRAIEAVNRQELAAQHASKLLASGQISDIHTVTITAQKAELALDLAIAVRNKVVEAYQEVMRMQV